MKIENSTNNITNMQGIEKLNKQDIEKIILDIKKALTKIN